MARPKIPGRVTQKDIAKYAGVSHQTVSFILTGRDHLFRPEMKQRVMDACKALNYRPSAAARAIRSGRCGAIGLINSMSLSSSYLPSGFINNLHDILDEMGLHLVYSRMSDEALTDSEKMPMLMRELAVDGLIVNYTNSFPEEMEVILNDSNIPNIWINAGLPHNSVGPDEFGAGVDATNYLIRLGHRRIVYVDQLNSDDYRHGVTGHFSIARRCDGYKTAMRKAGLEPKVISTKEGAGGLAPGEQLSTSYLDGEDRATAAVFFCEYGLPSMIKGCADRGLKVPEDFSFVVFGDALRHVDNLKVSTFVIDYKEIAKAAIENLNFLINNPSASTKEILVPFTFSPGETTMSCTQ